VPGWRLAKLRMRRDRIAINLIEVCSGTKLKRSKNAADH
jgi:hypothetical protein